MTIRVPSQYPTIQAGVNAANPGDVVLVEKGTYTETVDVSKSSIRIIAEKKHDVILQAVNRGQNPFTLNNVTNVEIYGFVIQNSLRGVFVYRGGYHRIIGNIMQNSGEGILTEDSTGNFIYQNTIRNNDSVGVLLGWNIGSTNNSVVDNTINNNGFHGIEIWSPVNANNSVIDNKLFRNSGDGVKVKGLNTLVYGNEAKGNSQSGVNFEIGDYAAAADNEIEKNTGSNLLISSHHAIIIDNDVEDNGTGIEINGNYNIVQENDVEENTDDGIEVDGSKNTVAGNDLEDNTPQSIDNNGTDNNIINNDID